MPAACEMPYGREGIYFISLSAQAENFTSATALISHFASAKYFTETVSKHTNLSLKELISIFFQRNKSLSGFVKCASREILLRIVKYLRAWVDLFLFTFRASGSFHNERRALFHIRRIFHFTSSLFFCIIQIRKGGVFYVCFQTS